MLQAPSDVSISDAPAAKHGVTELSAVGSGDKLFRDRVTDVDEIIGDTTERDPELPAGIALVSATSESMSPLDHAASAISGRCGNQRFFCSRLRWLEDGKSATV